MDLSIVFQGRAEDLNTESVCLIRKVFPDAYVVLSSWEGTIEKKYRGMFDLVVENQDPGPDFPDIANKNVPDNFKRQRVSTLNGMNKCDSTWMLKLRTDVRLTSSISKITELADIIIESKYQLKFCVSTAGSVDPKKFPILLHFSDLIQFGLKDELIRLWRSAYIPLDVETRFSTIKRKFFFSLSGMRTVRTACEQRLWLGRAVHPHLFHYDSLNYHYIDLHNSFLTMIYFFDTSKYGIILPPRVYQESKSAPCFYQQGVQNIVKKRSLLFFKMNPVLAVRYFKSWSSVLYLILKMTKEEK